MHIVEWRVEKDPIDYRVAEEDMKHRAADIAAGRAKERVWLLEHPPIYTGGTSAKPEDLVSPDRFPVYSTGRGGQYTYHGPGQRVAYVMLNLRERKPDVRRFVCDLEQWIIDTLSDLGVTGIRRAGRVGIWVPRLQDSTPNVDDKIAALGIRLHKWVSYHGISINVAPDLEHFSGIVPCGIEEHGVTSLDRLGLETNNDALDNALQLNFQRLFDSTTIAV